MQTDEPYQFQKVETKHNAKFI